MAKTRSRKKPVCPVGHHTDHIIPIVYGEPTKETMDRADKGLVYIGGCLISQPSPKYYCKIHEVSF